MLWDQAGVRRRARRGAGAGGRHAEPGVLLTMRTPDLPSHSGQIAFPAADRSDRRPAGRRLREAEEIGLDAE